MDPTARGIRFPNPIPAEEGAIKVNFVEFATLPDVGGNTARPMLMSYEPGTRRLFVNDMHGALYAVSNDGKTVTPYFDHQDPRWNIQVQFQNFERGFQSFAFHPDFNRRGARGYGKIYTYTDTSNVTPTPDWPPAPGAKVSHHAVLLEWTAKNPAAATYDGDAPRELMRWHRPFVNHNGGQLGFNPPARRGSADYGLLYAGNADGGSGGDPMNLAQNLGSSFGKILRIDPLGNEQRERQIRHSERQPVRERQRSEYARRDLRVRRAQPAAFRVGFEDRHDVHGRHRPGHRRGSHDGTQRARTSAGASGRAASAS